MSRSIRHAFDLARFENTNLVLRFRSMQTEHIVALLVAERDKLNRAIEVLQGPTKRRGRPPKNLAAVVAQTASPAPSTNGRGTGMTAAARKAQSKRMKAYWAKRKKQSAKK
jgi:hypothetical protein